MSAPSPTVRDVSDTALWVAIYRAMESERPDALFRDPFARTLGGARGEEIVRTIPRGRASAWAMITRTAVMDEILLRIVREHGVRTVVNLAAGLDARPYRLPLPPELTWLHVDLPVMIDYVRAGLAAARPVCRVEFLAADVTDAAARRGVLARAGEGPVLVLTEGLLIYLTPEQVAELARDLAASPARWWIIDLGGPKLLERLRKTWHDALVKAPFLFGPEEGTRFFEPHGWREGEFRPVWTEANRLGRTMRGAWLWNVVGRLMPAAKREAMLRMSGIVLLVR